jgi:hypothetical protein
MRTRRALIVVASLVAALIAGAGSAMAYWATAGSGTGTGTTGTMTVKVVALQAGDSNATTLIPGGTADAIIRVQNPNAFAIHVSAIAPDGAAVAGNGCTPTGVTFTAPADYSAGQFTIAAESATTLQLTGAVSMDYTAASSCQGATFTVPVSVTVQR